MKVCQRCGSTHNDTVKFCTNCGAHIEDVKTEAVRESVSTENSTDSGASEHSAPTYYEPSTSFDTTPVKTSSGKLNIPQFIWSLILTICCCIPTGIVSLILTAIAQGADTIEHEKSYLYAAKILNIVGTIAGLLMMLLIVIYTVVIIGLMVEPSSDIPTTTIWMFI